MSIVHLRHNDPSVRAIIAETFPEFTGRSVTAIITNRIRLSGTQWSGGYKTEYCVLRLSDMTVMEVPEAPFMSKSEMHDNDIEIPNNFAFVAHTLGGRGESIAIYANPTNITPLLPAPNTLSRNEMIVLIATRSRKSSYAGISDYRFHEANRETGIAYGDYQQAKRELIAKRLLTKAGAITVEGRNIAGSEDLYSYRPNKEIASQGERV